MPAAKRTPAQHRAKGSANASGLGSGVSSSVGSGLADPSDATSPQLPAADANGPTRASRQLHANNTRAAAGHAAPQAQPGPQNPGTKNPGSETPPRAAKPHATKPRIAKPGPLPGPAERARFNPSARPIQPAQPSMAMPFGIPTSGAPDRLLVYASRLGRTLAVARALVISSRAVDLQGVQDGVGLLCAQTLDLPTAEARQMLPALRELLAQVDTLTAALRSSYG